MINEDKSNRKLYSAFQGIAQYRKQKSVQLKFLAGKTIRISDIESGKADCKRYPPQESLNLQLKIPEIICFLNTLLE